MNPRLILQNLPPFNNRQVLIKKNQNVNDIIKAISIAHNQYKSHYDKIARDFLGHSKKQTAFNIWSFLKRNIPYKAEPESMQTIKSPAAIISTGLMGRKSLYSNDCKNYSLFAGGILSALNRQGQNIPYVYRFASYNILDAIPGHVFIVINPGKNEIWLDAVLKKFDYKKPYQYKIDKNFDEMMYSITGIDDVITGRRKARRQQRRAARKATRAVRRVKRKAKRKEFRKNLVKKIKKAGRVVLKVGAVAPRNAFLLITRTNFRSLASNLKKVNEKNPARLREFWEGVGGQYQKLLNAIEAGAKRRRLGEFENVIGVEPVTTATAAAATASPLIIKVVQIMREAGIDEQYLGDLAKKAIENKIENAIENAETQSEEQEAAIDQGTEQMEEQAEAVDGFSAQERRFMRRMRKQRCVKLVNGTGQEVVMAGDENKNKNLLLIAGVGVAALLLMKKK